MDLLSIVIPIISHIVAAFYLQKRKYNKLVTASFWGLFVILAIGMLAIFKKPPILFAGLLVAQFVIFCLTTVGPFAEKLFLLLTYANSFSICIGINLILSSMIKNGIVRLLGMITVIVAMHLLVYNVLVCKYRAAKKYFISGFRNIIFVLILFLIQFLYQYAFNIVDENSAKDLLFDFLIFSVIFNATLIIIFDSVKSISETNKITHENHLLKDIANTDALTDMKNRLAYASFIDEKRQSHAKDKSSFIFAMLDIDDFKNINDTKGHAEGDRVLKLVAATITEHCQKYNFNCFRIGGDEFVILAENTCFSDVQDSVKKLNKKLLKNNGITLSYGCATVDFHDVKPFETAYKKADLIMYQNKQRRKAEA